MLSPKEKKQMKRQQIKTETKANITSNKADVLRSDLDAVAGSAVDWDTYSEDLNAIWEYIS